MEKDDEKQKKKRYIQLLSLIYMQTNEFDKMKNNFIRDNENLENLKCYLVNKDMIDNYKDLFHYQRISEMLDYLFKNSKKFDYLLNENYLEYLYERVDIDLAKLEPLKKQLIPPFFETERLNIQGYYYPYNFFILREEIFKYLFENEKENKNESNNQNNNKELCSNFNVYNLLIGKEGVYIWDLNKQKGYISIYFLDDYSSEINKVYLFKEEEEFLKELNNNIMNKEMKDYFSLRNIKNKDEGLFNLIDDGKIIGKYINVFRNENFEEKTELKEFKKSFTQIYEKDVQKIRKINDFLKYLLINLSFIDDLREYSQNFINKEKSLLGAYYLFAKSYKENIYSNLEMQIKNFINVFLEKSLGDSVFFNDENKNKAFEKLIENVIDSFNKESNPKNDENKIFDLFYGEKNNIEQISNDINQNNKKAFYTLYINPNDFISQGRTPINLNIIMDINNLKNNKIDIIKLPNILIIILENNNYIEVPSELNVQYGYYKKNYKFLSSIRKNDNMDNYYSIVKKGKEFSKTYFNSIKNSYEKINDFNAFDELRKSFIFFYETTMREEKYTSGNNEIFTSSNGIFASANVQPNNNSSNNFIANNGGYQDIYNTGNSIYNQFYNNNNCINYNNNMINNNNINNNNNIINNNIINNGNIQNIHNSMN